MGLINTLHSKFKKINKINKLKDLKALGLGQIEVILKGILLNTYFLKICLAQWSAMEQGFSVFTIYSHQLEQCI